MEYQKIVNLLDTASSNASRFIQKKKKKWIEVYD